jgi:hypothetical protein
MRRIPLVLLSLALLAAAARPARAAELPLRSAPAEILRVWEGLWDLLAAVFTRGGTMDPNGGESSQGDRGGTMDPDGAQSPQGDRGGDMDPNG